MLMTSLITSLRSLPPKQALALLLAEKARRVKAEKAKQDAEAARAAGNKDRLAQIQAEIAGHMARIDELKAIGNAVPAAAAENIKKIGSYLGVDLAGVFQTGGSGGPGTAGACSVHNPGYDFNDALIAPGAAFWRALVTRYLVA